MTLQETPLDHFIKLVAEWFQEDPQAFELKQDDPAKRALEFIGTVREIAISEEDSNDTGGFGFGTLVADLLDAMISDDPIRAELGSKLYPMTA